jgi:isochorismate hydrolase
MEYLKEIKQYNVRHVLPNPGKSALLVIDMQRYFQEVSAPILDNVLRLIGSCRETAAKIAFTRHGHHRFQQDGGMLAEWWDDLIMHGTDEWNFIEQINPRPEEPIFDKNRYSAFRGTRLEAWMRENDLEELIITGVLTNCCCETTAREAFVRDYRVFFVSDATATVNEELHLASLKNLAFGFAHIVNTAILRSHFEKRK